MKRWRQLTSYDYSAARLRAKESILKHGGVASLITKGSTGGYDSSGNLTPDTPDTIIDGVSTPFVLFTSKEVDGESIINGDSWVYFQCDIEADEPKINMQITQRSKTLRVINVSEPSSIDGIVIYHKLQLRS